MEVHLKPDQEAFIQHRVSAGVYATADEAVQAAVALLEEREASTGPGGRTQIVNLVDVDGPPFEDFKATGADLIAAMQASPYKDIDLEPSRPHLPVRDIAL